MQFGGKPIEISVLIEFIIVLTYANVDHTRLI